VAQRYDVGELKKPVRMDNGWLRVDGLLTRSGVFPYRNADGSTRLEYRPPDEVFRADSLESFALVPFTNDHPPEVLNAKNTKTYAVGSIGENVRRDGDHVRAQILVTDAATAEQMMGGKVALSCGYSCDVDMTPGEVGGVRYDAVQKNIRGNHVALVDIARAGPAAKVRMDAGDAVQVPNETPRPDPTGTKESPMLVKFRVDGVEVEVTETAKQVIEKQLTGLTARADKAEADLVKATARADAAEAARVQEKARADAAEAPARIREAVKARVELERTGAKVLGKDFKADASDVDLKVAIVEKVDGVKLDPEKLKVPAYLDARFDSAVARAKPADGIADELKASGLVPEKRVDGAAPVDPNDVAAAAARMDAFVSGAWKRKPTASDESDEG